MRTPQAGTLSTSLVIGTMAEEQMLRSWVTNTIVLLEGALMTTDEANKPMVSALKGLNINMATLPWDTLYVL